MTRRWTWLALLVLGSVLAAQAGDVDVRPFRRGSWEEITRLHQGRPLVVHFWGVTCVPCRTEMPEWGAFVQERPAADIVFLHAERMPPDPRLLGDMLRAAGLARGENWAFAESFLAKLRFEIDPTWQGELPMTILIAPDATRETIVGTADFASVRRWIASLAPAKP